MKKAELKAIAERYGMGILREEIAVPRNRRGHPRSGRAAESAVVATKLAAGGTNLYHVYCPTSWFDLWGWKD